MRAEGSFCNLDVLYGGLGIGKLQFLIKKKLNFFSAVIFFQFMVIKALDPDWIRIQIRIGTHPKMLDLDQDEMNADPQPCSNVRLFPFLVHLTCLLSFDSPSTLSCWLASLSNPHPEYACLFPSTHICLACFPFSSYTFSNTLLSCLLTLLPFFVLFINISPPFQL